MDRPISHTGINAQYAWPEDTFLQGGKRGLVFRGDEHYFTAFVEAFVANTFLRGEGETVEDAEAACWRQYERLAACPAAPEHGPFEARGYTNGAGYCSQCGTWFSKVLPAQPDDPNRRPSALEQLLRAVAAEDEEEGQGAAKPTDPGAVGSLPHLLQFISDHLDEARGNRHV